MKFDTRKFASLPKAAVAMCLFFNTSAHAQPQETIQELSKAARKGVLSDAALGDDGNLRLTYKMKLHKRSDEVAYEDYVFGKDLTFSGIQKTKADKVTKPDQTVTTVAAYVGGSNSFNVLSMSLKLQQEVWERHWDYDRQTYKWGKRLSSETVKPKNNSKKYKGFAAYPNDDDGSVVVLASIDKNKEDDDQFVFLHIANDLTLNETDLPLTGSYSLVYTGSLDEGGAFAVFAPDHGMTDTRQYVYIACDAAGKVVSNSVFSAPSPNTLIMDYAERDGDIYFVAGSDKSEKSYSQLFVDYAPINSPGFSTSANFQMAKYEKKVLGQRFDNFHLIRLSQGKLVFASTTPSAEFKSNVVKPPSQRKSHPYTGKNIRIQNLFVTLQGDYLVAGQLQDKKVINKGNAYVYKYYDYVCLHFDKNGVLKAQYAVEKAFSDSKNESFPSIQNFIPGGDGNTVYWELMEVKVAKSYASFGDAYSGTATYTSHYFPRIARIDLANKSVTDFTGLGEKGKYLVYHSHTSLTDESSRTRYYIGHDADYKKIWLGRYNFE